MLAIAVVVAFSTFTTFIMARFSNTKAFRKLRILISVILMTVAALGGFVLLILSAFSGDGGYMPLIIVATIVIFFLIPLTVLGVYKARRLLAVWGSLVGVVLLAIGGVEGYKKYDDSFDVVYANINLANYMPYKEGSLVATLDEPASFTIDGSLSMDGATALYPVYAAFAQATYPKELLPATNNPYDSKTMVASTKTPYAYERLITGDVDMIFIANPSVEQKDEALAQGVELEFIPIGREAFVFLVNADNKVKGLATEQIRGIYSGKITNWRELGGSRRAIKAFQRNEDSGSQSAFLYFMDGEDIMPPIITQVASAMGGMIDAVADYKNYPGAIGYSFRYFTQEMADNSQIKLLELDGVYPSIDNIRNGSYPQAGYFYAVIDKNNPNPNIRPMLEWILSPQGQALIERTGYVGL